MRKNQVRALFYTWQFGREWLASGWLCFDARRGRELFQLRLHGVEIGFLRLIKEVTLLRREDF